jgi:hypothetical protein
MAYCEHGYPCANSACLLRLQAAGIPLPVQQESLLVQGLIQNPPGPGPFPGNNAQSPPDQHQGLPPNYPQHQGPPPTPGNRIPQPPIYFYSQPISIPPPAPLPSHPLNTYHPPNPYMQYAAPGPEQAQPPSGLHLPPWIGNNQSAPTHYAGFTALMPVVGPPAPMPLGGYTPGSQHPLSVTASHPSNRPDPRPERPIQTASGGWYHPNEQPGVPHAWLRGGGTDRDSHSESQEQDTDEGDVEEGVEEGAGAHRCLHCGRSCQKSLTGRRLSPFVLDFNEDELLCRQGQARSEEDLRQAARLQPLSPEHFILFKEPDSTDAAHDPRSNGAGLRPSTGNLPTDVVEEYHSSHHSSSIGKPLLSQSRAIKVSIADQKSTVTKEHKDLRGLGDSTSPSHCHVLVAAGPIPVEQLRGKNFGVQRGPSGGSSRREGAITDPSILLTPSYQPRIPPTRLPYSSREGRLYNLVKQHISNPRQRALNSSGLNYTLFTNHICAHEDQNSPIVLEHLGIPYEFHDQNSRWIVVRIDVTDELLQELLDRTRIKRNYTGQCSDSPVGSDISDSSEESVFVPGSVGSDLYRATVLEPTPADASGIRGGGRNSTARSRAIDLQPKWNTSGSRRVYRLSRTGQLTFGGDPVTDADYLRCALPICINADRRDLLPRILYQESLDWRPLIHNRIEIDGYIAPDVLRELLQQSRLAGSRKAENTEEPADADEAEKVPSSGTDRHDLSHERSTDTQTKGKNEARVRGGASGPRELRDQLDKYSEAYPGGHEGMTQPDAPQTRILDLTINLSIRDDDRYLINPKCLSTFSEAYDILVNQHTISRPILAELDIPRYYDSADPDYSIITGSIPVDLIEILAHETRLRFHHVAHHAAVEAERQRELENQDSDGSWSEGKTIRTEERRCEHRDAAPLAHVNLRGGASSPEDGQSLSPLSPRRRPGERPHEYNRRRLQYSMESRSHLRADEDRGSEHTPNSDPELDWPETDPDSLQNSSNNFTRHRSNAVDLRSSQPWDPEQEAPWVLEQEAAQAYRNAPPRDHTPHSLTNGARNGRGENSAGDENTPFPVEPHGQEAQLWDAVLFSIPEGGRVTVTRENADLLFVWQMFDAAGNEVEGGERYDSRIVNGDAGGRLREGISGVIFAEGGAGAGFVAVRATIGLDGEEGLRRRGRPVGRR